MHATKNYCKFAREPGELLGGTCTLLDRKKRDDKITQPKHPGQHEQSIYPRTLCILTHLDINKTAKVCYSNLNVEFSTWNLTTIISVTMVFQTSFFWAINYYDQAKVGTALLHTQGTPNTEVWWCFLGLNRQTKVKATSPIPSSEAPPDMATVARQDKHSQGIHIQHQGASINIYCLSYGCRLILEKLIVTANLRFFFPL